jgi:prepilin-type N-terminal cleavage/methylation domain-containing protein
MRNPTTDQAARDDRHRRRGMTILEVLVVLSILGLLAAVMLPVLKGRIDSGEAAALADNFTQIRRAVVAYRNDVGRYPRTIEQLGAKPGTGSVPTTDICAQTVPVSGRNAWRGPYVAQLTTTGGVSTGASRINDTMERNPANTSTQQEGHLRVIAVEVTQEIAIKVDRTFDGGTLDLTGGGITWVAVPSTAHGTLTFNVAIRGC